MNISTQIVSSANNDLLLLDNEGGMHAWSFGRKNLPKGSNRLAETIGKVLDIAATWHSSLRACQTMSGVYFWGEWLGKEWECPTSGNFISMDALFAIDKGCRLFLSYDSIMYRPFIIDHRTGHLTS